MNKQRKHVVKFKNAMDCICDSKIEAEKFIEGIKKEYSKEEFDDLGYKGIVEEAIPKKELENMQDWEV